MTAADHRTKFQERIYYLGGGMMGSNTLNIGVDLGAARARPLPNNWETLMHLWAFTTFPQIWVFPSNIFDKCIRQCPQMNDLLL